jgi:hypothetical protein
MEQDLQKKLQETQNFISTSLITKHNLEIHRLKQAYDEEIRALKESHAQKLDEKSSKSTHIQVSL